MNASEYQDDPDVLREKIACLAKMVLSSKQMTAYTGAGISTSSGIGDYATKGKEKSKKKKAGSMLLARPTLAHRTLTALHEAGYLKHWIQQNHDGLPQKAGFPQEHMNEIHGKLCIYVQLICAVTTFLARRVIRWYYSYYCSAVHFLLD